MRDEHLFRRAIENAITAGVTVIDNEGRQSYVNAAFCQMVGWSEQELLGVSAPYPYWPPEEMETITKAFQTTLQGNAPSDGFELILCRADGSRFHALVSPAPLYDSQGNITGWVASVMDISKRVQIEQTLQQREALFHSLAENLPHMAWISRVDGTVEYCNQNWYDCTGTTRVKEAYDAWKKGLHPEDREVTIAQYAHCRQTGEIFEREYRFYNVAEGGYRWHLCRTIPIKDAQGNILRWSGTTTDIDSQKQSEATQRFLAELYTQFRTLFDPDDILQETVCSLAEYLKLSRCHYAEIEPEQELVIVHKDYCRGVPSIAGIYPLAQFGPMVSKEARQGKTLIYNDILTDPRTCQEYETVWKPLQIRAMIAVPVLKEGRFIGGIALQSATPRHWKETEIRIAEKVMGMTWLAIENARLYRAAQDEIAERQRVVDALQESELKFRSLFENAQEAIGIATEGRIIYVNPAYSRLLGYDSPEEMIGMLALDNVAQSDRERLSHIAVRRREGEEVPFSYEFRGLKKDGTECDLENYVSSYKLDGHFYTVVTTRDVTERKKREIEQQFLSEASSVLASSLDYAQTLQQVADLAVPHIADWCGVDMLEEDGSINQLAVAHVDPEKVKWGYELRKRYPVYPDEPRGLPNVLRTGLAEIYSHIPDQLLVEGARDEEHLAIMRMLGLESVMMVPMIARGRTLGAITFVATKESGHHYTEEDLALAEGLAARAGLAIDNARLYHAAQTELHERRRMQEALHDSEERFRFALANSTILVYTQDRDLRYTWVYNGATNSEDSHVYGKTDAELIIPEDARILTEIKHRVLQTGIEERHLVRATRPGEESLYLETSFAPLRNRAGNLIGITGTANDVTERKKAQDALALHQTEMEALNVRLQRSMRETHHRVKNNLQVISALVNMQQMQYEDLVPTAELQRITQHIRALASIHDLLSHQAETDDEVSEISLQEVMSQLVPTIQAMTHERNITFKVQDLRMPVRQTTTFAVLVNELISNALKHGAGEIQVHFGIQGTKAKLEVLDEGPGFATDFDPIRAANTGLDLISSLTRIDMRGEVCYENREEGGARVLIEFPVLLQT